MSKTLFTGVKPGYGPVLKIMADASYDPLTTPNTDYHKFRFNSEVEAIGYTWGRTSDYTLSVAFAWTGVTENSQVTPYRYPYGSNNSSCTRVWNITGYPTGWADGRRRIFNSVMPCLDRGEYASLGYRSIMVRRRDRSDWTSNWTCLHSNYPGWSDGRYVSIYENVLSVTTLENYASSGPLGPYGLVPRHSAWNQSYEEPGYVVPNWFGPGGYSTSSPPFGITYTSQSQFPTSANDDLIITELPLENDPYPAVSPSFVGNVPCLHLSPTIARMSKPGFNVDMATHSQLIFSQDKFPLKCVKSGYFTLPASGTININIDYPISTSAWVEDQINVTGEPLLLPPFPSSYSASIVVEHRIVGQQLRYRNQSSVSVDVRFFVMSGGHETPSTGSAPVVETGSDIVTIRRPGTAGTSEGDIILDSRVTTLPIVAQGWVDGAALTATPSDSGRFGTRMHVVNFTNDGSFKPLVMAMAKYSRGSGHIWQSFFGKNIDFYSYMSASTFMASVTDTQIKFYFSPNEAAGARFEDSWRYSVGYYTWPMQMTLVGFRYYIFAVPPTL